MFYDRSLIPLQIIFDGYEFMDEYNDGVKYLLAFVLSNLTNRMIQIYLLDVLAIHVEINYNNSFAVSSFTYLQLVFPRVIPYDTIMVNLASQ